MMKKTMVYLEDTQFYSLKKTAVSSKKKMAELIREAVAVYLAESTKPSRDYFSFVGIAKGDKNGNTSEQSEEILRKHLK